MAVKTVTVSPITGLLDNQREEEEEEEEQQQQEIKEEEEESKEKQVLYPIFLLTKNFSYEFQNPF